MSKRKKIIFIIGLVLIMTISIKIVKIKFKKEKKDTYLVPVEVVRSVYKNIEDTINLTGDVRGFSEAKVYSRVPGKLQQKVKDVGDIVLKDDVAAFVDRDEPALEFKLSEVNSPLSGVITQYFLDIGETVTPQLPIFEVASIDMMKAVVNIAEKDITKIKKGLRVSFTVDAYPGKVFYGEISKISQSVDLQTRSIQAEIFVSNEEKLLKPGMFAKVRIVLKVHKNVLTIPYDAIGEFDSQKYVYVVKHAIVYKKNIRTGISQDNAVEILDGITGLDDVVLVGWQNLTDGMKVEVIE